MMSFLPYLNLNSHFSFLILFLDLNIYQTACKPRKFEDVDANNENVAESVLASASKTLLMRELQKQEL